jgi:hypothetical protein
MWDRVIGIVGLFLIGAISFVAELTRAGESRQSPPRAAGKRAGNVPRSA